MDASKRPKRIRLLQTACFLIGLIAVSTQAATSFSSETEDLIGLSLEELLQVTVTSVSRKPQSLSTAAAAIFVVTQDDIRSSGARTIPDVLRMVPGIQVAQVDSSTWAVTARGSNGIFANKLLVLMDGRTLYDPEFSGVYWDIQDTTLASIERIEVIRGPGAALWGANAVNGVINIITKNTKTTHGLSVAVAAGTSANFETNVQWGGAIGDSFDYRIFGKYFSRDGFAPTQNGQTFDDWDMGRIGGRLDWSVSDSDTLTLTSEYYDGSVGQNVLRNSLNPPSSISTNIDRKPSGGFVNIDWKHSFSDTSNLDIKMFYDYRKTRELAPETKQNIYDFDLQHRFEFWSRHDVVWGFGVRNTKDETRGDDTVSFDPANRTQRLYNAFVQDEIRLLGDEVFMTIGTKLEKNSFSQSNDPYWSPNFRLSWLISNTSTLWGSVARAIRTPSRIEQDGRILGFVDPPFSPTNPSPVPFAITIMGNPEFDNEKVTTYELGYRAQPFESMSIDIALFYNNYDNLRESDSPALPVCQPLGLPIVNPNCFAFGLPDYVNLPITFINNAHQDTKGIEIAATYNATEWWRIYGTYSYLEISGSGSSDDPVTVGEDSPKHQVSLRSNMNISNSINLNIWARYIDELKIQQVDGYVGLDVRLAWQALTSLELSLVGRNLLETSHLEFREESGQNISVEIDREVLAEVLWHF